MKSRILKSIFLTLVLAFGVLLPVTMSAQNAANPASKSATADSASVWDIFLGYSYLAPKGSVNGTGFNGIGEGGIASISRYFNKNWGVQAEGDIHSPSEGEAADADFSGGSGGLVYRYPTGKITPFLHVLVGAERVGSYYLPDTWGPVVTAGGGLDWNISPHVAIRFIQADYQYTHENFPTVSITSDETTTLLGGSAAFNSARLSAGIVFGLGEITPPPPVTIACSASPASIFAGDPVAVTATVGGLIPKLNVIYSWSGDGVTGNGTTASVSTGSLAPGTYTVKCGVKEGKPGKEGLKPGEAAESSTSFTVKAFEPPTISCAANPMTIKPGESAAVTASAVSPQNRPLTYSYSAASGTISGTGNTATFNSTGAPTGAVGITCNVSDDKGHAVSANTSVSIVAPYVPPIPHTQALCSIAFDKDLKRPTRVDNEAKACLDEVALSMQKQSDAKVVVVGESDAKEKDAAAKKAKIEAKKKHPKSVEDDAAMRAVNSKEYLVTEKGIDASRVSVATSSADGQKVEDYLVPAGATFSSDVQGTAPVDENTVKPEVRKPLPERKHSTKKAK